MNDECNSGDCRRRETNVIGALIVPFGYFIHKERSKMFIPSSILNLLKGLSVLIIYCLDPEFGSKIIKISVQKLVNL